MTAQAHGAALVVATALAVACSPADSSGGGGSGLAAGGQGATAGGGSGPGGAAAGGSSGGSPLGGAGGGATASPPKPAALTTYLTGNDADAAVQPAGPALVLMGGSSDVDGAFQWWKPFVAGGDVVVLRTSGSDGYNDYLYSQIGGFDSVETMMVQSSDLANEPYVAWRVRHAEGVFIAGGDQAEYLTHWRGSELEQALMSAYLRGAAIGGTSAGCAVLGPFIFAAYQGSVLSSEALSDPYNSYMQLERDFLSFSLLDGVITDSHFSARDRMGRLVGFMARLVEDGWAGDVVGVGVDECTALVVAPSGQGEVLVQSPCGGQGGAVYVVHSTQSPTVCTSGQPLEYSGLRVFEIIPGDTVTFPGASTSVAPMSLSAAGGALSPADPY